VGRLKVLHRFQAIDRAYLGRIFLRPARQNFALEPWEITINRRFTRIALMLSPQLPAGLLFLYRRSMTVDSLQLRRVACLRSFRISLTDKFVNFSAGVLQHEARQIYLAPRHCIR